MDVVVFGNALDGMDAVNFIRINAIFAPTAGQRWMRGERMSEKREKRRRYNQRIEYIANFNKWLDTEPPIVRLISWHRWKKSRPIFEKTDEEVSE